MVVLLLSIWTTILLTMVKTMCCWMFSRHVTNKKLNNLYIKKLGENIMMLKLIILRDVILEDISIISFYFHVIWVLGLWLNHLLEVDWTWWSYIFVIDLNELDISLLHSMIWLLYYSQQLLKQVFLSKKTSYFVGPSRIVNSELNLSLMHDML